MSEADTIGIALALGMTAGAVVWEWLRGDLFPQLRDRRNQQCEARLRELEEQPERAQGAS